MAKKLTVVISQSQSQNPTHRHLEEELATRLLLEKGVDVSLVPHLYDLSEGHTGTLFLKSLAGDLFVLSWMYPRASRWVLDRMGVRGQEGVSLLKSDDDNDEEFEENASVNGSQESPPAQGIGSVNVPKRKIYCADLREHNRIEAVLEEVRRIVRESNVQTVDLLSFVNGAPSPAQMEKYLAPRPENSAPQIFSLSDPGGGESVRRRWYPVIDYSRCTNCMECIDFCLFGVYGLDNLDRILVEQQDNCKKGCPACSRVCPENAIMFPAHKTAAIAGANGEVAGLKIDLSKLFGAPNALEEAVLERDTELVADGREAVGMSVGVRRKPSQPQERNELDDLIDRLDDLSL